MKTHFYCHKTAQAVARPAEVNLRNTMALKDVKKDIYKKDIYPSTTQNHLKTKQSKGVFLPLMVKYITRRLLSEQHGNNKGIGETK